MFSLPWVLRHQPCPTTSLGCLKEADKALVLAGRELGSEWQKGPGKRSHGLQLHS